nr:glycosyltransferase [uncultured Polaribacter sp.]
MILTVLFYFFVAFTVIQIIYYLFFSSILFHKDVIEKGVSLPVSVIICAKNEAKNLSSFLPYILEQSYSNFEVILINDASSDATLEVMQSFKKENERITIIDVKNNESFWGNKKYALTLGIKAAKNNHLLFTDADCKPLSKNWITTMVQKFKTEKTIVLGYGKYKAEKSIINLLVRYETLLTAMQYFSYAKIQFPYMGVGRNLAYTKDTFFNVNGFISHIQLKSGDDDLFIQDAANKENTTISMSKSSFTESLAPTTFKQWFLQKRRHVSTAKHYKFKHQFFLALFYISKLLFYLMGSVLLFFNPLKILVFILTYYLVQILVTYFSAKKLEEPKVALFAPFLEIGLLLFQLSIFITNLTSKPTHWK